MALFMKALNYANLNNRVSTVYSTNEAEKMLKVHCKSTILFMKEIK